VVSMQVLCSVRDVKQVSKDLYRLLRPGGEIILWEHQRSRDRLTCILQTYSQEFGVGWSRHSTELDKHKVVYVTGIKL